MAPTPKAAGGGPDTCRLDFDSPVLRVGCFRRGPTPESGDARPARANGICHLGRRADSGVLCAGERRYSRGRDVAATGPALH